MNRICCLTRLLFAASLAFLPACNTGGGPPRLKVAFVSNNPGTFWTICEAGCRKAESETGVEVLFRKPSQGDPAAQTEILENLRTQDVKAICVSVVNPKTQTAHLNEIAEKIPLITTDNDAPDSKRLCYLGTDNYVAGRAVGRLVKEAMPEGGVLAAFVGQIEPLNSRGRLQGMLDELADKPAPAKTDDIIVSPPGSVFGKYKYYNAFTDQPVGEQKASQNATDVLTALADERNLCMVGLWSYNTPAILSAVKDKGRLQRVKIIGFDEDGATLQGVADGHVYATVVQDPFAFGYESTKIMAGLARGDKSVLPASGLRYVPHRIITKDGGKNCVPVAQFKAEMDALLKK
jgi:ribose transport system substrate-binding protein